MNRRTFAELMAGLGCVLVAPTATQAHPVRERQGNATPEAAWPTLDVEMTDSGFVFPPTIMAGRTTLRVRNTGTRGDDAHWALGRLPDGATDAEMEELMSAPDGTPTTLHWEQIGFVGVPDWPRPGGDAVSGIVDLHPGRYVAFAPISDRATVLLDVGGTFSPGASPDATVDVDLHDYTITLPDSARTSGPVRWKITNTGGTLHEVAVVATPEDFTPDDLIAMLMLPEGATPAPDMPVIDFSPVAAIGMLGLATTTWLDVRLDPGHYLAVCMLPFGSGHPHIMDGMSASFTVS